MHPLSNGAHLAPVDLETLPPTTFLTYDQLAPIIGISVPTLKRWAANGQGPKRTYLESRPRYRVSDILAWIEGRS